MAGVIASFFCVVVAKISGIMHIAMVWRGCVTVLDLCHLLTHSHASNQPVNQLIHQSIHESLTSQGSQLERNGREIVDHGLHLSIMLVC